MKKTSRHRLLDAVELIAHTIAEASHYQELINTNMIDYESAESKDELEKIKMDTEDLNRLLIDAIEERRQLMADVFDAHDGDKRWWCLAKHTMASYMLATEILYANIECEKRWIHQQKAYERMIAVLSKFLGADEMVTCGRCLADELDRNGKDKKKSDG